MNDVTDSLGNHNYKPSGDSPMTSSWSCLNHTAVILCIVISGQTANKLAGAGAFMSFSTAETSKFSSFLLCQVDDRFTYLLG